ncbi:glycosyltransferase [Ancylobacter sp. TS-1]|uniref:glycosyltransferase n=1 Tax=Ancylobacter sp. TS-1 TaxID=1850374 RepID=UPI001265C5B8|nr:glycosyltransferase [Ancylobacter sp. TS-1]QFR34841.1 glycosyltransferase [Ancylobacter sp. TS-1]
MAKMRVSVVMPSYRHAAYIAEAIRSVLDQSVRDIELIVVDDASPDESNEVIARFDDPRLIHVRLAANVGGSEALNTGLRRARAPLIALCNSDDAWEPGKLQRQLDILERSPDIAAVFTNVAWVDTSGKPLGPMTGLDLDHFAQENRPRHAWLKRLVEDGNCLCHPSILIRREVYAACGYYDSYLRQLPDYDMWLRLLQRHQIHVLPERLVRFRVHPNNTSSGRWRDVRRRDARETLFILRRFFEEITEANFAGAFLGRADAPGAAARDEPADPVEIMTYLLAYEGHRREDFQEIALERLYRSPQHIREAVLSMQAFQSAMAMPSVRLSTPRGTLARLRAVLASLGRALGR